MLTSSEPRTRTITRSRLLGALNHGHPLRLIRIIAPAGYGKTSLAAAWIQQLAELPAEQRPATAWVSLFSDVDAEQFVRSLVEALESALPDLHLLLAPASSGELSPMQAVAALCRELASTPRRVILVIDDVHLLAEPLLDLLQPLLDLPDRRLSLVLLSRATPPLHISHLILDDAVLTLGERELAFDHDEFSAFSRLVGLDAQPLAVLDDLERRCNGWVTGLRLLSYDIIQPAPDRILDPAADDAIRHFLEVRVFGQIAAPLRNFALATAILPWITPDLMATVSGASIDVCVRQLAELAAAVGFLSEFDAAGERRLRFHPLIHDALRSIAASHGPQHTERRRAAAWFLAHEDVDAALSILAPDIDPANVADELAAAVQRALVRFDLVAARRWLDALPAALLETHTPLALAAAWLAFLAESIPHLDAALPRAAAALGRDHRPDLLLDLAVLESYHLTLHERRDDAARRLADLEAFASPADSLGSGYRHVMRMLLPHDPADFDARTRELQTAADIFERIGFDFGVIQMMFAKTVLKRTFGDLRGALADSDFLQGFAHSHGRQRHRVLRDDLRQRGEHFYFLNRIDEARAAMQSVIDAEREGNPNDGNTYIATLYVALCDFAQGIDRPTDPARDAERWAQILSGDFVGNLGYIAWPRILRDFRAGDFAHCWQTVETLRVSLDALGDHTHHTVRLAVLGGAVLSRHSHPDIALHLDAFLVSLGDVKSTLVQQQLRLLRVLHALFLGQDALALERLQELLPLIEQSGALRLLLDFPYLQPLLQRCDSPFARRLRSLFLSTSPTSDFGLTSQEVRILEQLAVGSTTKQIAAAHTVTLKTIYRHIHNIFQKLGVHNRKEALRVWRGRSGESE